jgi:hypothetical protein
VLTRSKESADLVNDGVTGARRGGRCDMKEAEEVGESMLAERVDHKHLLPAVLPIHVCSRNVDDAQCSASNDVDVHCDENRTTITSMLCFTV